jgi:hypothetical protein
MSSASEAVSASAKNSSKKSPMRKKTSASGCSALAANHCAMAGEAPEAGGISGGRSIYLRV